MSSTMKIGICLPYMKVGLNREDYLSWFRAIDEGPFHALSCGERFHGPTYDMRVVLAAAAMAFAVSASSRIVIICRARTSGARSDSAMTMAALSTIRISGRYRPASSVRLTTSTRASLRCRRRLLRISTT